MPSETPGSPFSTLPKVVRVIKARCAISMVEMRRRKRAARMSAPNLVSALLTGSGNGGEVRMFLLCVHYYRHKTPICPLQWTLRGRHWAFYSHLGNKIATHGSLTFAYSRTGIS